MSESSDPLQSKKDRSPEEGDPTPDRRPAREESTDSHQTPFLPHEDSFTAGGFSSSSSFIGIPSNASFAGSPLGPLSPSRQSGGEVTNVKVMVRVRPFSATEIALGDPEQDPPVTSCAYVHLNNQITVLDPVSMQTKEAFAYDHAFWSITDEQKQEVGPGTTFATQQDVYDHCGAPVIEAVYSGRNSCIFAYGQTGSGKTHTMMGSKADPGLIPRIIKYLFIESETMPPHVELTISASFLEIYNEKVKDLLDAAENKTLAKDAAFCERKVRFTPELGTHVVGLKRATITSAEECEELISAGTNYRTTASTKMNDQSSRSHAILQLHVKRKDTHLGVQSSAIMNLVDLAGSERIRMSGVSGAQLTEAKNINLSLTTLRRVIDTLIENGKIKSGHRKAVAPYRESMLTWVLCDSLGGNCRTTMLGTISPHARNMEDTLNTLRYALKAKAIACVVKANEEKCAVVVNALKKEMEDMKRTLMDESVRKGHESEYAQKEAELAQMKEKLLKDQEGLTRVKSELHGQVVKQNIALRKIQSSLSIKKGYQEEAVRIQKILDEVAEMQREAARRTIEEESMQKERERQIQEARSLELEIGELEKRQLASQEVARQALKKEKEKGFAILFQTATKFGKDRSQMKEVRKSIDALKAREAKARDDEERKIKRMSTVKEEIERMTSITESMNNQINDLNIRIDDTLRFKSDMMKDVVVDTSDSERDIGRVKKSLEIIEGEVQRFYALIPKAQEGAAAKEREESQTLKDVRLKLVDVTIEEEASERRQRLITESIESRSAQVDQHLLTIQEQKAEERALFDRTVDLETEVEELEHDIEILRREEDIVSDFLIEATEVWENQERDVEDLSPKLDRINAFLGAKELEMSQGKSIREAADLAKENNQLLQHGEVDTDDNLEIEGDADFVDLEESSVADEQTNEAPPPPSYDASTSQRPNGGNVSNASGAPQRRNSRTPSIGGRASRDVSPQVRMSSRSPIDENEENKSKRIPLSDTTHPGTVPPISATSIVHARSYKRLASQSGGSSTVGTVTPRRETQPSPSPFPRHSSPSLVDGRSTTPVSVSRRFSQRRNTTTKVTTSIREVSDREGHHWRRIVPVINNNTAFLKETTVSVPTTTAFGRGHSNGSASGNGEGPIFNATSSKPSDTYAAPGFTTPTRTSKNKTTSDDATSSASGNANGSAPTHKHVMSLTRKESPHLSPPGSSPLFRRLLSQQQIAQQQQRSPPRSPRSPQSPRVRI